MEARFPGIVMGVPGGDPSLLNSTDLDRDKVCSRSYRSRAGFKGDLGKVTLVSTLLCGKAQCMWVWPSGLT